MPHVNIERNEAHYKLLGQDCQYYYQIGGRWSAKTTETVLHFLVSMLNMPGLKIAIFRKVYDSIRDSIYADAVQLIYEFGLDPYFTMLKSPFVIRCHNGSEIIFKGAQDPERLKGLAGINWAFLEELNEFDEMDFETIDQGMRGKTYPRRMFMAHNPVPRIPGSQYWFESLFVPKPLEPGVPYVFIMPGLGRVGALKTTYLHNKFVPAHVKTRLEGYKTTNPALYKLWTKGDYTEVKGAILKNWDEVNGVPAGAPFVAYGLDFGFANDPAACLKVWATREDIWLKGLVYSTGLTNRELVVKMQYLGVGVNDKIIADSAEPKSIEDLFRSGFRGIRGVKKRANYKADMALVLQGYKIHIVSGDIDLKREIATWSWDEDKTGKLLPKPRDGNDHYMDSMVMVMHDYRGDKKMKAGGA